MNIDYQFTIDQYQSFVDENCSATFMQSIEWAKFEQSIGHDIVRFVLKDKQKIVASAQLAIINAKRGKFAYLAHGPVIEEDFLNKTQHVETNLFQVLSLMIDEMKKIARINSCAFLRVSTTLEENETNLQIFQKLGARPSPTYLNSENAWVLDIRPEKDIIMSQMRKTTRYLIKNASKQGVKIITSTQLTDMEKFYPLYQSTVKRENFTGFSYQYLYNEAKFFLQSERALFLFGIDEDTNQTLGGALIIFNKKSSFYHQGASLHSKKPIMYALHFQGILTSKERGCENYNFWGVEKKGRTPKGWEGLSSFKRGFGGSVNEYLPTQDFILSKSYYKTFLIDKIFSIWRKWRTLIKFI